MDWVGSCKIFLNRPKVVHRLPGRLRVHVPFLQKLPREYDGLANRIAALLAVPDEIESATTNLMTGNALICYDPASVTEVDVIGYLRGMFEIFVRNRERFEGLKPENAPLAYEKLEQLVREAVQPRLNVDTTLVLNENVLE